MKCEAHSSEATAVCTYCGRALCPQCERATSSPRIACSEACADALAKADRAINLVLTKHIQGARITAYYLYILGAILVAVGISGYLIYQRMTIFHQMSEACGFALFTYGVSI